MRHLAAFTSKKDDELDEAELNARWVDTKPGSAGLPALVCVALGVVGFCHYKWPMWVNVALVVVPSCIFFVQRHLRWKAARSTSREQQLADLIRWREIYGEHHPV